MTDQPTSFRAKPADKLGQHPVRHLAVLFVCCIAVFLAAIPVPRVDGQLTGSDGAFYYAYLPTLLVDRDLDFSNQYENLAPSAKPEILEHSEFDRFSNKYAVGPAVLWAPFFLAGHLLAILLNAAGYSVARDGMGYVHQIPTLLGSMVYGFAGILLVYRSCRRFFCRSDCALAALLIWLATNLIYYMLAEPSMAHTCSFFAVALFIELWLRFRPTPTLRQWILLGLAGGLVALVRLPDATWLALPFVDSLVSLGSAKAAGLRRQFIGFLLFVLGAAAAFSPQLAIWLALKGSAFHSLSMNPYEFFYWMKPEILKVLFSLRHGFYTWHPVLLLATAGGVLLHRKDRILPLLLGLMFAAQLYVVGAWSGWWGGDSFGGRMLVSSLPALALGLAALFDWAGGSKARSYAAVSLALVLIAWNGLFFAQYRLGYISKSDAITIQQMTVGKFLMLKDLASRVHSKVR